MFYTVVSSFDECRSAFVSLIDSIGESRNFDIGDNVSEMIRHGNCYVLYVANRRPIAFYKVHICKDTKVASLGFLIMSGELRSENRNKVIRSHILPLVEDIAKEAGCVSLFSFPSNPIYKERFLREGFVNYDNNVSLMGKLLK